MIHFMENLIDSYCGMDSSKCSYVKAQLCDGCTAKKGNPTIENCEIVACAKEKGLENCGFCDELLKCKKGFYTTDAAFATKAKALFIKEHGEECYLDTLKRAVDFTLVDNNSKTMKGFRS